MFAIHCPREDARVLRWSRHVLHVGHPAPGAVDVVLRCACGEVAVLRTGRDRAREELVHGLSVATGSVPVAAA